MSGASNMLSSAVTGSLAVSDLDCDVFVVFIDLDTNGVGVLLL